MCLCLCVCVHVVVVVVGGDFTSLKSELNLCTRRRLFTFNHQPSLPPPTTTPQMTICADREVVEVLKVCFAFFLRFSGTYSAYSPPLGTGRNMQYELRDSGWQNSLCCCCCCCISVSDCYPLLPLSPPSFLTLG